MHNCTAGQELEYRLGFLRVKPRANVSYFMLGLVLGLRRRTHTCTDERRQRWGAGEPVRVLIQVQNTTCSRCSHA